MLGDMSNKDGIRTQVKVENTLKLMKLIASHLSYRVECRDVTYYLYIEAGGVYGSKESLVVPEGNQIITFIPNITVCKDKYNRKEVNKDNVIAHILKYHFELDCYCTDNYATCESIFLPGEYIYRKFDTNKHRRWYSKVPGGMIVINNRR